MFISALVHMDSSVAMWAWLLPVDLVPVCMLFCLKFTWQKSWLLLNEKKRLLEDMLFTPCWATAVVTAAFMTFTFVI